MVFKNQNIHLTVKQIILEYPSYWSIFFDRPVGFEFEAGDWIDLQFEGKPLNGGITYSISSSPFERYSDHLS